MLNKPKLAEIDFEQIINLADSAICLFDVDGSIVYSNKKANEYLQDDKIKAQITPEILNNTLISSKNKHFKVNITKLDTDLSICVIKNISENVSINNELMVLQEIEKSMSNVLELNSLLDQILNGINKLGFDSSSLYLIDEESNSLEGVTSTSTSKSQMKTIKIEIAKSEFLTEMAKNKKAVFIQDLKDSDVSVEKELLLDNEVISFLCLPLIVDGNLIGI